MITTFKVLPRDTIEFLAARHDGEESIQHALAELLHLREREQHLLDKNAESLAAARAARGVLTLRWMRVGEHDLPMPARAHDGDAGIDLPVLVDPRMMVPTDSGSVDGHFLGAPIVFRTGWAVAIPPGWYGQLIVRSSVGKAGWDLESSGVIDSGYRGEIEVPLAYRGDPFNRGRLVRHGDRLVQMVVLPVPRIDAEEVKELPSSTRGAAGFGSTGRGSVRP